MLTLREAAHILSPAELIQVPCECKWNCGTICCKCFKVKVESTLHCHGQDGGVCSSPFTEAVPPRST